MHAPAKPTGKQVAIYKAKVDRDAVAIGNLWRKAKQSLLDSNKYYIACGERLIAKRAKLAHGEWLPWLKANAEVLGFTTDQTARLLMKAASNPKLTLDFSETNAVALNRMIWSNKNHRTLGTGINEWRTPEKYIDAVREVLGSIDLDPASNADAQRTVRAARYYTKDDDGLTKEWRGTVFLNPPYAQPQMSKFVAKLIAECRAGRVTEAIMLTHNFTETRWFQAAIEAAPVFCLPRRRVRFVDVDGELAKPTQGQALFFFGPDPARFIEVFRPFGEIVARVTKAPPADAK